MAAFLLSGAIIGGTRTVTINGEARTLQVRYAFWQRGWTRSWRFDELGPLAVIEDTWSDGPPDYELTIGRKGRKPLMLRRFSARSDAEAAQVALERILA
jgi:hypothetical protein